MALREELTGRYLQRVPEEHRLDNVCQGDRRLGQGSYASVYQGKLHGAAVAVKRLHPILLRDESGAASPANQRFDEEISKHCRLRHPNIVQFIGVCPPDSTYESPGIVFERLPISLDKQIDQGRRPTHLEQCCIARDVAAGLSHLHSLDIMHRDVTTTNIMLTTQTSPDAVHAKIVDVGVARNMATGASAQKLSVNPGNQAFMAPETRERSGENGAWYSYPADCYSYGVTMLAMAVGRGPPSLFELAEHGREMDLGDLPADHPLRAVITRCLDDDPDQRPALSDILDTVGELVDQLQGEAPEGTSAAEEDVNDVTLTNLTAENDRMRQRTAELESDRTELQNTIDTQRQEMADMQKTISDQQGVMSIMEAEVLELQDTNRELERRRIQAEGALYDEKRELMSQLDAKEDELRHLRQQVSQAQADVERLIRCASCVDSEEGMIARCQQLFRRPDGSYPRLARPPKWEICGELPQCLSLGSPAVHDGKLYIYLNPSHIFAVEPSTPYVTSLDRLQDGQWDVVDVPGGPFYCGSHFFTHDGILHTVCLALADVETAPHSILKMVDGQWQKVTELPEVKFFFSMCVCGQRLFIVGGTQLRDTSFGMLWRALISSDRRRSVHSFDLGIEEWVEWPSLPFDGTAKPGLAVVGDRVIAASGSRIEVSTSVLLDTSKSPSMAHWEPAKYPENINIFYLKSVSNIPVVAGGLASVPLTLAGLRVPPGKIEHTDAVEAYVEDCNQWLPLPSLNCKRGGGALLKHERGIIRIGGYVWHSYATYSMVTEIEVLDVSAHTHSGPAEEA